MMNNKSLTRVQKGYLAATLKAVHIFVLFIVFGCDNNQEQASPNYTERNGLEFFTSEKIFKHFDISQDGARIVYTIKEKTGQSIAYKATSPIGVAPFVTEKINSQISSQNDTAKDMQLTMEDKVYISPNGEQIYIIISNPDKNTGQLLYMKNFEAEASSKAIKLDLSKQVRNVDLRTNTIKTTTNEPDTISIQEISNMYFSYDSEVFAMNTAVREGPHKIKNYIYVGETKNPSKGFWFSCLEDNEQLSTLGFSQKNNYDILLSIYIDNASKMKKLSFSSIDSNFNLTDHLPEKDKNSLISEKNSTISRDNLIYTAPHYSSFKTYGNDSGEPERTSYRKNSVFVFTENNNSTTSHDTESMGTSVEYISSSKKSNLFIYISHMPFFCKANTDTEEYSGVRKSLVINNFTEGLKNSEWILPVMIGKWSDTNNKWQVTNDPCLKDAQENISMFTKKALVNAAAEQAHFRIVLNILDPKNQKEVLALYDRKDGINNLWILAHH